MNANKKMEFRAVLELMPSLNHYQILKLSPAATTPEIQSAFHREALQFHPDRYANMKDSEMTELARKIYVKIVEAYKTLSHRQKRLDYDTSLKIPNSAAAGEIHQGIITSVTAKKSAPSGPGTKFYKLAFSALQAGDINGAKLNIKLAINMEPDHHDYLALQSKIETQAKKKS